MNSMNSTYCKYIFPSLCKLRDSLGPIGIGSTVYSCSSGQSACIHYTNLSYMTVQGVVTRMCTVLTPVTTIKIWLGLSSLGLIPARKLRTLDLSIFTKFYLDGLTEARNCRWFLDQSILYKDERSLIVVYGGERDQNSQSQVSIQ